MKRLLVISSSFREGSNSELLAREFMRGAIEAGNEAEIVTLKGKKLGFCRGCLACQSAKDGHCVQRDDADLIAQKMKDAGVLCFATPIYYYGVSGQLKTMLDRANPLFPIDYSYRSVYLMCSCAEDESAAARAVDCVRGWIDCFEGVGLRGVLCATGADEQETVNSRPALLAEAYMLGKSI